MCWDMMDGPCGGEEDENWFCTGGVQEPLPVQGGLPGSRSSRRESHPVPDGFPPNVVLQRGEEVSHCGQTKADIRVDGESGKSGAAMLKVSSS